MTATRIPRRSQTGAIDKAGWASVFLCIVLLVGLGCWFYGRSNVYLLEKGGELMYGLAYPDSKHHLVRLENFESFRQANSDTKKIVIIMMAKRYAGYKEKLPKPSYEDSAQGFVFVEYKF